MTPWPHILLLLICAAAAGWPVRRAERGRLSPVIAAQVVVAAAGFAFLLSRLQGGRLVGDFFASGLWGRGALALAVAWVAGLSLAFDWLGRAGLPLPQLTLIAMLGVAGIAGARGNYPALALALAVAGWVAALWRWPRVARLAPGWPRLAGFLVGGAAVLLESGPGPHVAFSAWWVALFVPLLESLAAAVRSAWRWLGREAGGEGQTLFHRLAGSGRRGRLTYWAAAAGASLLALAHYGLGWPGVHAVVLLLGGAALALDLAARRATAGPARRERGRWGAAQWAAVALLLVACLTGGLNLFHQGFLTWDESRYAVIARDSLTTGDLGWTGARPVYILSLKWAYAAWGAGDSIGGGISLLAGVLSIAVAFAWARQAFGRAAGVAAAVALTASILHGWYSRHQDSMAVVMLFLALAGWAYARAATGPRPWRALVVSGAALGLAWMSHYAVTLALPFWLALAPFGQRREGLRHRLMRLLAFAAGLAVVVAGWVALMPPGDGPLANLLYHSGFPVGCCLVDDLLYHVLPGATAARATVPEALRQPAALAAGDLWYYGRALLAFEGMAGLMAALASAAWAVVRWIRRREILVLHGWVVSLGPFVVLSATAAAGLDARARPLMDILPSLAILIGLGAGDAAGWLGRRLTPWAGRLALGAGLAAAVLLSAVRAAPLRSMTTPYDEVRRWLVANGARQVVVLEPYGDVNGFAWRFYFGEVALFASTEAEALRACAEHSPDFMISAGKPLAALGGLPVAARWDNPVFSTIPRLYDQQPHSTYLGRGLAGPPGSAELVIHDLRGCRSP